MGKRPSSGPAQKRSRKKFLCFKILGSLGSDGMSDAIVSLGIIGAGAIWIIAGTGPVRSGLCTAIGVLTIAVGLISLLTELRHQT